MKLTILTFSAFTGLLFLAPKEGAKFSLDWQTLVASAKLQNRLAGRMGETCNEKAVKLRLFPLKQQYSVGKPIAVLVRVENITPTQVFYVGRHPDSLYYVYQLSLRNLKGRPVPITRYSGDPPVGFTSPPVDQILEDEYYALAPKAIYEFKSEIEGNFSPGVYDLRAKYVDNLSAYLKGTPQGLPLLVKGQAICSNILKIRVVR